MTENLFLSSSAPYSAEWGLVFLVSGVGAVELVYFLRKLEQYIRESSVQNMESELVIWPLVGGILRWVTVTILFLFMQGRKDVFEEFFAGSFGLFALWLGVVLAVSVKGLYEWDVRDKRHIL